MTSSLFTPDGQRLARLIASARRTAGVTQADLARALDKPQPFVSLVERGERRVDVIEFCQIARALGIAPAVLFDRFISPEED